MLNMCKKIIVVGVVGMGLTACNLISNNTNMPDGKYLGSNNSLEVATNGIYPSTSQIQPTTQIQLQVSAQQATLQAFSANGAPISIPTPGLFYKDKVVSYGATPSNDTCAEIKGFAASPSPYVGANDLNLVLTQCRYNATSQQLLASFVVSSTQTTYTSLPGTISLFLH